MTARAALLLLTLLVVAEQVQVIDAEDFQVINEEH